MGKSDDTKREIMKSAVAIFAKKGYAASTTREIADSAGVSEAALFKYYKNKKGLLHETVLTFIEQMGLDPVFEGIDDIVKMNKELTTEELFIKLFSDRIYMIERNFQIFKILFIEIQYHEDVRDIFMEKIMGKILHYTQAISLILEEREDVRSDLDYFTIIRSFLGGVFLTVMQKKLLPELDIIKTDMDTEIKNMVDLFMKGILKEDKK
jgi:AcrR family transcriptional regulator